MRILIVVIEKYGLLRKKKEILAHIYLNSITGIVIDVPDQKLKIELRKCIELSDEQIKANVIQEKSFLFGQIQENLRNQKLEGAVVKELIYFRNEV